MVILRKKDIKGMKKEDKIIKLNELKLELIKGSLTANKQNAKTKEIKRTIARLMTLRELKDSPRTK